MKFALKLASTTAAVLALGAATTFADMPKAVGDGEGQVDIVAWPGYIERGETDKAYDWVTSFEKETSCKVNVKTAATSDEMVTLTAGPKGAEVLVLQFPAQALQAAHPAPAPN